jgi:hypothetical protein
MKSDTLKSHILKGPLISEKPKLNIKEAAQHNGRGFRDRKLAKNAHPADALHFRQLLTSKIRPFVVARNFFMNSRSLK